MEKGGIAMTAERILIPYNFTQFDEKALTFAVRTLGHLPSSEITLFNAYTPVPDLDSGEQTVMGKLKGNLSYLKQKISEQENALQSVVDRLRKQGWPQDRVRPLFRPKRKDVAGEILDLVQQDGFAFVVLSRRPGRVTRFFAGSVSSRVLTSAKNVTVCVVT
jgi:nucleotide-binding universal stress UspA family protein